MQEGPGVLAQHEQRQYCSRQGQTRCCRHGWPFTRITGHDNGCGLVFRHLLAHHDGRDDLRVIGCRRGGMLRSRSRIKNTDATRQTQVPSKAHRAQSTYSILIGIGEDILVVQVHGRQHVQSKSKKVCQRKITRDEVGVFCSASRNATDCRWQCNALAVPRQCNGFKFGRQ